METISLDAYVLHTLMPDLVGHDRQPSAFLVYLFLWARTLGAGRAEAALSHQTIARGTGLAKRTVQDALSRLLRRRLVAIERSGPTEIIVYSVQRPWARRAARS